MIGDSNIIAHSDPIGRDRTYYAIDIENSNQARQVIRVRTPLSEARTLDWERADPVVN